MDGAVEVARRSVSDWRRCFVNLSPAFLANLYPREEFWGVPHPGDGVTCQPGCRHPLPVPALRKSVCRHTASVSLTAFFVYLVFFP